MNELIKTFVDIECLDSNYGISMDNLKASGLFMDFDILENDDIFRGKYKDIKSGC